MNGSGGDGLFWLYDCGGATVAGGGDGDDRFFLDTRFSADGKATLTGGVGNDSFEFSIGSNPADTVTITEYLAGEVIVIYQERDADVPPIVTTHGQDAIVTIPDRISIRVTRAAATLVASDIVTK